ncbi:SMI1/KNR4 family protein [Streptomyces sp. NPDC047725]|uniref:SMI1/KNR4 family protein n=1 Tax=Streptomyces sp. NPDC047725 TaxID=3365487 RepID=UPI0037143D7E
MSSLDRLRVLLGEPVVWGWARPRLWTAAERYLGVGLPSDYKAFLDLYGPGSIDGYLWLSRPLEGDAAELDGLWSLEDWRRARLSGPDLYPYPFHPDPGGLISWGSDEDGSRYYFLALEPDPDEWRIVVSSECNRWFETAGTFCDFLVRCFDRIDRPPFMPRRWPFPDARYHSDA